MFYLGMGLQYLHWFAQSVAFDGLWVRCEGRIFLSLCPCLLLAVSQLLSGKRAGEDNLGGRCWGGTLSCPPPWEGQNGRVCSMLLFSSLLDVHSSSA